MHEFKGIFSPAQGRAYERQEKSPKVDSFREVARAAWAADYDPIVSYDRTGIVLLSPKYRLPGVIKAIGTDAGNVEIKTSMGLDIAELSEQGFDLGIPETAVFLWSMGAFSDARVIDCTLDVIKLYGLGENAFFEELNKPYVQFFKNIGLSSWVSGMINPMTMGASRRSPRGYGFRGPSMPMAC
jgi:hypothetical protein